MSNSQISAPSGKIIIAAMPAVFVFFWSTGFVGAKFGLPYAEPATFLAYRFTIVSGILFASALFFKAGWPGSWRQALHIAVAGLLLQAVYLGGVFYSIWLGVDAGVSALIAGLQPLLVAVLAGPLLGERISRRQWLGFFLGLLGVALVIWRKLDIGSGTPVGMLLSFLALVGITVGTLYQKKYCAHMDLRTGTAIQAAVTALAMWALSFLVETRVVAWTPEFIGALIWLCLVLSFGAFILLVYLIRRGEAARVSSLFFLVPPCTALVSFFLFDETFGPLALLGMAIAVAGVALVNSERR